MDAIDEVRRRLGELASMENELQAARCSRDHWRKLADERESELDFLIAERDACWVKLPTDTSGEVIRPGDTLETNGMRCGTCASIERYQDGRWRVHAIPRGHNTRVAFDPWEVRHAEEQRTVEDVLYEVSCRAYANEDERCDGLLEYAKEIRELLGVDDVEE